MSASCLHAVSYKQQQIPVTDCFLVSGFMLGYAIDSVIYQSFSIGWHVEVVTLKADRSVNIC